VDEILALIATVEVREKPRVVLACLKIADGNVDRLRNELANASGYYREILSEAESPWPLNVGAHRVPSRG
jgi:hypothetical protein